MKNLFSYIKIGKEILTFKDWNWKNKFYCNKTPIFLGDADIEKILVSNKIFFSEQNYKYFISYLYNGNKVKRLNIILSKASEYVKSYDRQTKWIYFLIDNDNLLEKCIIIWDKASADIKKNLIASLSIMNNF